VLNLPNRYSDQGPFERTVCAPAEFCLLTTPVDLAHRQVRRQAPIGDTGSELFLWAERGRVGDSIRQAARCVEAMHILRV
jgi:hypothetical protein